MSARTRVQALSRTALMIGVSAGALMVAPPALAREQPAPAPDTTTVEGEPAVTVEPGQPPVEPDAQGEIVVTGSRIRRTEATSESPLLIIDPVIAQRQGRLDTAELIQKSATYRVA